MGKYAFDVLFNEAEVFVDTLQKTLRQNPIEKVYISGNVNEIQVAGELNGFSSSGFFTIDLRQSGQKTKSIYGLSTLRSKVWVNLRPKAFYWAVMKPGKFLQ